MVIPIIALVFLIALGVLLIVFSQQIGIGLFNFYYEIRSSLSETFGRKAWLISTGWFGLWMGPRYFIWFFRIFGIICIVVSAITLYVLLSVVER